MVHLPLYIREQLDKFQICSCPKCGQDAVKEVVARMGDGTIFFLASCSEKDHVILCEKNKLDLLSGMYTPQKLVDENRLELEELFFQPAGHQNLKCKYSQWITYLKELEKEVSERSVVQPNKIKKQEKAAIRSSTVKAPEYWTWIENIDKWMNTEGNIVRIANLHNDEFISAVQAIIRINFSRVTKRVLWTKELLRPIMLYEYPEEELNVGAKMAGEKLEEFREEASDRGLI